MAEPWLSADDITARLGVTKDTVCILIVEEAMPAHKVGRHWKFQASEIYDWVRRGGAAADFEPPARVGVSLNSSCHRRSSVAPRILIHCPILEGGTL